MKKSLFALSIATLAASSVASATTIYEKDGNTLDVYGRVQSVIYSSHQASYNKYEDSSLQATGRLGVNARTNLTTGVDAFANMEWDVADARDNEHFNARYAFIGADFGTYGSLKAGRFEDAVKYVITATDIFDDFGANADVNDTKLDGMFMYSLSNNGFDLNLGFQTAQDAQELGVFFEKYPVNVNHAYSASVGYTSPAVLFGPISAKAGYSYTKGQDENPTDYLNKIQTWASSLSWGNLDDGFYVAAMYNEAEAKFRDSTTYTNKGYEAVVGYAFANGVSLRTGYNYMEVDQSNTKVEASVVPVYLNYQINPAFNIWTEARFDVDTDKDTRKPPKDPDYANITGKNLAENVYSVGARYTF